MRRLIVISALLSAALAAGIGGAYLHGLLQPQPAHAQKIRAKEGIRVAICNIEEAARKSRVFEQKKAVWTRVRQDLEAQRNEIEGQARHKHDELRNATADANAGQEKKRHLELEFQVLKQKLEHTAKEHEKYLGEMLMQYQNEVLREVSSAVETIANHHDYDIVFQDYSLDPAAGGLFSDSSYAQTLLTKPVFYVPNLKNMKNAYVTDITQAVIEKLQQ